MDPIGLAGGLNLYGYAGGDPINFGDPFGLCKVRVGWTATPVGMGTRHAFIEVTRPDNSRVFFRGGPTGASSSASSKNSADGYLSNADATSAETKNVSQNGQSVAGPIQAESQSPNDPGNDSQGPSVTTRLWWTTTRVAPSMSAPSHRRSAESMKRRLAMD
ncbi:MAG: hypothetical protein IPJ78_12355 [Gemmatimonadetes bacterium]|nr:hypothetical protein [Gemmatimonadota bacterium]